MTKALKLRLQKIVQSVKDEDIVEFWNLFKGHMKRKEAAYVKRNFNVGDEVFWKDAGKIGSGTIIQIIADQCRIRHGTTFWTVSGILLTKEKTLKV